ncbi:GntR family transcriptional regulator / MocR family aminotransferase [Amycolatopsis xylanica]|uniref:GntR family transcriptional regulator / MocR family aminotransferase n=1 Tax=Amycolatopsis xylanica TaxID=589385 RepID=A0A1H3Q4H6_9PSEU|nr:PLP-dependent aminotransferase family protein [Amycolatopsis xylanica]SDZ07639.1 GntR family transcriptional regulator / MocR family aminotransferase [Amycolatopsis xylanica]
MDIHIEFAPGRGRRDEIYRQLRAAILDGRLRAGDPLPPTRELARRVEVSRNTVSAAYDRLTAEGFLDAHVGSGTFVRDGAGRADRPAPGLPSPLRPVEIWDAMPNAPRSFVTTAEFDFRAGVPDLRRFPFDTWRRLVANQLRESAADVLTYGDPQGHPGLRAAIARQIGLSRGVRAEPDDVLVTGGAQQAIDLVARVLLRPGEHAAVEDPGYPPPRLLFQTLGARVHGVPVDDEGLVVDAIPPGCRLVYVTPSHQYPIGTAMSLRRRLALLDWGGRNDAAIIEDDYDTEFRYAGRPLEPLHSLDSANRVLYVGSFSKVLAPGLRLGFLVAPPSLRVALTKAKSLADWQTANPIQAALAQFMDEGGFARHVRASRREYEARHDLVRRVLERDFAGLLTPIPSSAGLHVSAFASADMRPVVKAARKAGIRLYSLEDFTARKAEVRGLVFGYGAIPLDRIEPGLRLLRRVL